MEDALKVAYTLQNEGHAWHCAELARSLGLPDALAEKITQALIAFGWAEEGQPEDVRLTKTGEDRAVELIRAHRLWELYLVNQEEMPLDAVHAEAHHREHEITAEELEKLDAELGYPAWDPHGHVIPASDFRVPSHAGRSLLEVAVPGSRLRIVSLDDEPVELLTQLIALGLKPGIDVEIMSMESNLLRLRLDENVIPLSYTAAGHVFVVPATTRLVTMGTIAVGGRAQIVELTGSGKLQRRMLSMGFVPGAEVTVIREAPLGDPLQYRVKKANIALRQDEADTLLVKEFPRE
jgi:Fe2+ transport system protein FeoA/Mn-dependent DtxR family transcriptional regulator